MAAIIDRKTTRAVHRIDRRSWLRWGIAILVSVEVAHAAGGVVVNDWEGWRTFFENVVAVFVSGLVMVALTFGLLVRWGLKQSQNRRNRSALAGLIAGAASVLSFVLFFIWAPLLVAPAAVLLGREGLRRAAEGQGGRGLSMTGMILGLTSLAFGALLIGYALLNDGDFPFGLF